MTDQKKTIHGTADELRTIVREWHIGSLRRSALLFKLLDDLDQHRPETQLSLELDSTSFCLRDATMEHEGDQAPECQPNNL